MIETARCRGCNRKIIWGTTDDGKKIPLDAVAPCYAVVGICYPAGSGEEIVEIKRLPRDGDSDPATHIRHAPEPGMPNGPWVMAAYVSHFATCTKASQFSKQGRGKA